MVSKKIEQQLLDLLLQMNSRLAKLEDKVDTELSKPRFENKKDNTPQLFSLDSVKQKQDKEFKQKINPKIDDATDLLLRSIAKDPPIKKVVRG